MMVRNEQHVIASCIGHMLQTLGVSRVYVVDNGSVDRTPDILRRIAAGTGRVVAEADDGPFRQHEILTALARRAAAEGAAWVLPSDADEFLWLRPGLSLAALCRRDGVGGYRVPVRNFLQARPVRREWPGALATMCVSAIPQGGVRDAQAEVSAGRLPFVRMAYPTKLLLRATPGLQLTFGHHDAQGADGPLVDLRGGEVLHAPIRSFQDLHTRMETGQRVAEVTPEPSQNWHLKRVAAMDGAAVAEEWRRNSFPLLRPVERGATRLDFRLSRIGLRQAPFQRRYSSG